jgi:hypothetical protein
VNYKQPNWELGKWKIHHDNSTAHSAQNMWKFLAKHNIPQVRSSLLMIKFTVTSLNLTPERQILQIPTFIYPGISSKGKNSGTRVHVLKYQSQYF